MRILAIPITGGDRLDEWMPEFLELMKHVARDLNCTELRGYASRDGWIRKLKPHGWEIAHTTIRCKVGE